MVVYKVELHVRMGGLILIGNDYNNGIAWEVVWVNFVGEGTVLNCFVFPFIDFFMVYILTKDWIIQLHIYL